MFEHGFLSLDENAPFSFTTYCAYEGVLPESPEECDAYIITGSRHSVLDTEVLWINQLQHFIVRLNKAKIKTIGVCFGHQIMAVAMGGKVERADCGWQIGIHPTNILRQQSFMRPPEEIFYIAMFCEDQVVSLGESAIVLAEADKCKFAMLQYGDHMLSLQGHPEFNQAFAKASLNVRQEDFPSKRFDEGVESFSKQDLDGELLFQWLSAFLLDDWDPAEPAPQ